MSCAGLEGGGGGEAGQIGNGSVRNRWEGVGKCVWSKAPIYRTRDNETLDLKNTTQNLELMTNDHDCYLRDPS